MRDLSRCLQFSIEEGDEIIRQIKLEYHFLKHLKKDVNNLDVIMRSVNKIEILKDMLKFLGHREHLDIDKELQREYILSCIKDFENILHK